MFKSIIRYKFTSFLYIIGVLFAMIGTFFIVSIYNSQMREKHSYENYSFESEMCFDINGSDLQKLYEISQELECNVKVTRAYVCLDEDKKTIPATILIHSFSEKMPIKGHFFSNTYSGDKREVILGKAHLNYSEKNEFADSINIFGEKYNVIGTLEDSSDLYDYTIVLNYAELGKQTIKNISSGYLNIKLESDFEDTELIYNNFIQPYLDCVKSDDDTFYFISKPLLKEDLFCIFIYADAFILISMIMTYMIYQRNKEFRICRAFGYSPLKILLSYLRDIIILFLIGAIISSVIIMIIIYAFREMLNYYGISFSVSSYIIMLLIIIFSMLISCIKPIKILYHNKVV